MIIYAEITRLDVETFSIEKWFETPEAERYLNKFPSPMKEQHVFGWINLRSASPITMDKLENLAIGACLTVTCRY